MPQTVRPLRAEDAEAYRRLGQEAFGLAAEPPAQPPSVDAPGRTTFGAFRNGRLVGRMAWRDYHSWFGGRQVRTCGIAGVTVAAEDRGQGALRPLFAEVLDAARTAGAVISTLFPTAPRIYRGFGYELISDYATVAVPNWVLGGLPRPAAGVTRRAEVADVEPIRAVYDAWAAAQNGPLSRRGVSSRPRRRSISATSPG